MRFVFGEYSLDIDRRELKRGTDQVAVEPQVFDLLVYLIQNRDRVVTKDDLLDAVWGGRVVSESTLTSRIKAVRTAIGDSGEGQHLVKTIARRGFRFVGTVQKDQESGHALQADLSSNPLNAIRDETQQRPSLPLPDKPSIVVLPFANLSGDPSQDYFADGMVEDITIALARLPQLFVIGSASAFTYKGRGIAPRQVGTELGVRYVLQGSVRKERNQIRITAQLTDAAHGNHVWSNRFEGELDKVFALQDSVAAQVSTMIAPALRTAEIALSARKPTTSLTAYDLFLQASRQPLRSYEESEESLRLLYQAVGRDPHYGAAYGLAAFCVRSQKVFGWISPSDAKIAEGVRLAHLAYETGRDDSEALAMLASSIIFLDGDLELALAAVERAIALNANSPNGWWASGLTHMFRGDIDTALDHLGRARRLNPFEPLAHDYWMATAIAHFFAENYVEASRAADKSLADKESFPPALRLKIAACGLLGQVEDGREYVGRLLAVNPGATIVGVREYFGPLLRRHPRGFETYFNGLRLCGFPEGEVG